MLLQNHNGVVDPMYRSNWGIIAAIIGCLAFTVGVLAGAWASQPNTNFENFSASSQKYEVAVASGNYAAFPKGAARDCYGAPNHDSADLCAQWRAAIAAEKSAESARWANGLSIVGAVLTLIGAGFVYATLKETRRAADAAHDANRPWIDWSIEIVDGRLDDNQLSGRIVLKPRNLGGFVALHAHFTTSIQNNQMGGDRHAINAFFEQAQHTREAQKAFFPGDGQPVALDFNFPRDEWELDNVGGLTPDFIMPSIAISCTYSWPYGKFQTAKTYLVTHRPEGQLASNPLMVDLVANGAVGLAIGEIGPSRIY